SERSRVSANLVCACRTRRCAGSVCQGPPEVSNSTYRDRCLLLRGVVFFDRWELWMEPDDLGHIPTDLLRIGVRRASGAASQASVSSGGLPSSLGRRSVSVRSRSLSPSVPNVR